MNALQQILNTARFITASPISHNEVDKTVTGLDSKGDYAKQMKMARDGHLVRWDDAKDNGSVAGDLFVFTTGQGRNIADVNGGTVEIRRILGTLPTSDRADYWNKTVHSGRNVLVLGEVLYTGTLFELRVELGQKAEGKPGRMSPIQGTKRWKIRK